MHSALCRVFLICPSRFLFFFFLRLQGVQPLLQIEKFGFQTGNLPLQHGLLVHRHGRGGRRYGRVLAVPCPLSGSLRNLAELARIRWLCR